MKAASGKGPGGLISRLQEQFGYGYDKAWNLNFRTNNGLVQTFSVNDLNELANLTNNGVKPLISGSTTSPATNVTVNGQAGSVYSDATFAVTNVALTSGWNTLTATARDTNNRVSSSSIQVNYTGSANYLYDTNGNLTSDGTRGFAYDVENELVSVWQTNVWREDFAYDGLQRRRITTEYTWGGSSWQPTNQVLYVYDVNLVVQERNGNNLPLTTYTRGNDLSGTLQGAGGIGGLLARSDREQVVPALISMNNPHPQYVISSFYHSDGNGNVTMLVQPNGFSVASYEYDPYGNLLSMSGMIAGANKYRFSSKEWNENSGLYCYGYRFYDPNLQRWLNRDPLGDLASVVYANAVLGILSDNQDAPSEIPGSDGFLASQTRIQMNLHRSMGNNPVNYYDAAGLADVYCKRQNGQEETMHNASVDDLAKKLDQAAKENNPIDDLRIKDHAAPNVMTMSGESLLTTSASGQILDGNGNDLTGKFKQGLTPNAIICLNGCQSGRGQDNIAKDMSQILPGKTVVGGAGLYQLSVPFTSTAIGKKNYYINGSVCNSQW